MNLDGLKLNDCYNTSGLSLPGAAATECGIFEGHRALGMAERLTDALHHALHHKKMLWSCHDN